MRREGDLLERFRSATFAELLAEYVEDPELTRVLGGQWGYLGSPPEEISAVGMVQMLVSYWRDGAWYPLGSTQAFSDKLGQSLLDAGAHLLLKHKVEQVLVSDDGRAEGVLLADGRSVRAPLVIANCDARLLYEQLLPAGACTTERAALDNLVPASSYFGAYWCVDRRADLEGLPRGFYYPPDGACSGALDWIYLSVTTHYDASLAPDGNHIISTTVGVDPASPQYLAWQEDKEALGAALTDYLESRAPGLRAHVLHQECASPRTLHRYTLARDGVAYGWAVLPGQAGDERPSPRTSLPGLYLAGQWTAPGPGVAAVAASGWATARQILSGAST